ALRAMYRTCAFDGCDVAFHRCEIHHIIPWERGGPTDLDNLIPLCSRHHHLVHDLAWKLRLEPDRTLVITQPDGTEYARTRPHLAQHQGPGADPPPAGPPGTGAPPDTGEPPDSGDPPDTGEPPDTGDPPDTGRRTPAA
ncbi:MAG: HNH endonuclease signature motif containing protein, partial [Actinomycetota bacterium]